MSYRRERIMRMIRDGSEIPTEDIIEVADTYPNISIFLGAHRDCLGEVTTRIRHNMEKMDILMEMKKLISYWTDLDHPNKDPKEIIDKISHEIKSAEKKLDDLDGLRSDEGTDDDLSSG